MKIMLVVLIALALAGCIRISDPVLAHKFTSGAVHPQPGIDDSLYPPVIR